MTVLGESRGCHFWGFALLFAIVVHPALADDTGDAFINNLLTDIAPILALFGERVTTQFLSQSFSIYDCIIFAVCPIGIVTAAVSAIRAAAPNSWRTLIGRAMESRATVELELLSSTSTDVCELWSGSALVRVMGSPEILELLYFPELDDDEGSQESAALHFGLFTLDENIKDRPKVNFPWPQITRTELQRRSLFEGKNTRPAQLDSEAMNPSTHHKKASPSISMNLSKYLNKSTVELRLMAICGVVVQLGVVGYSAMITYYEPWVSDFKKNGQPAIPAAFPLMAAGTAMVSGGMFICALVIEKCTEETAWSTKRELPAGSTSPAANHIHTGLPLAKAQPPETASLPPQTVSSDLSSSQQVIDEVKFRLLWLQKHKVVNDQAFNSCAIIARSVVGVLVSLSGFVLQFSGLRLMNWSATLAQLIDAIRLDHPTLTAMVQKVHQSGLASIEEAWDMVILPLSLHHKLPNPVAIVEEMRDRAKVFEQTGQWQQALQIQIQIVNFQRSGRLTQLRRAEEELKKMVNNALDKKIVRALLRFYKFQEPGQFESKKMTSPEGVANKEMWEQGTSKGPYDRRFDVGRLESKFNNLMKEFKSDYTTDAIFGDAAKAIKDLPAECGINQGRYWEQARSKFTDPLGLTLTHWIIIRYVKNAGSVLDRLARESHEDNHLASTSDIAGWNPLHYVTMASEVQEIIMTLSRHGASINARSRDGTTPLHCLVRTGTADAVARFLDLGATPTATDNVGYTPLHWAAWCGNVAAVNVLLSRGADPGSRDNYGRTALHLATIAWKTEAVAALSCRTGISVQDIDGNTALHYIALLGKCTLVTEEDDSEYDSTEDDSAEDDSAEKNRPEEDNLKEGNSEQNSSKCYSPEEGSFEDSSEENNAETDTTQADNIEKTGEEIDALMTALLSEKEESSSEFQTNEANASGDLGYRRKDREEPYLSSQITNSVNPSPEESKNKSLPFDILLLGSTNMDGNAPIHMAIEHGHLRVVERLLGPGEQQRETDCGITPLRLAVMFGHPQLGKQREGQHGEPNIQFSYVTPIP
ncbi:hypothetical protein G7Z17_g1724 [Cylindrodendrum hubeiense]|uniref:Uncharacterized protein n=1 Tax=Cylindrodendrum hubeiense TaxID=595255 RepID=A0A9P5HL47_9HYPO|nr:hypothetical protein G7Z17_g1724 [Cylindrodendrum hubeiense]